jgi:short-subunit dehydrogenase
MPHANVVVVTGASSGIGRATALRFAAAGAQVVGFARDPGALETLAADPRAGGRIAAHPGDVRDQAALDALADAILGRHGRIDVWVNAAGVSAFGELDAVPADVHRAVIETNLLGVLFGSRSALSAMRRAGRGTIVNLASIVGETAAPHQAAYSASKWGIRGFGEALRGELEGTGVDVVTVLPSVVDTPIWQHAANHTGARIEPPHPRVAPERVADAIVHATEHPRGEVTVGATGRALNAAHRLLPRPVARVAATVIPRIMFRGDTPTSSSPGNVFHPTGPHTTTGDWRHPTKR